MKEKNKNSLNKGISLIILVVTIVVVMILATVIVQSFSKNNSIENAKKERNAYNSEVLKEAANLAYIDWHSDETLGITDETVEEYIRHRLIDQGYEQGDFTGLIVTDEGVEFVTIPNGFVASKATGETDVENGMVIYEGTEEVTDANVEEARKTRNQFVWIPVENIEEFKLQEGYKNGNIQGIWNSSEPYWNASQSEISEYNAMYESVKEYGGFYIARYEASKNLNGKAQSVSGQIPWTRIKWANSMTDLSGGAVEAARAVYPESNAVKANDAVSTLVYGSQWDATIRFLKNNYYDIYKDGKNYGNYATYSLKNTASTSDYAQNNIFDMCGNASEWTMEAESYDFRVGRGGNYNFSSVTSSISYRGYVASFNSSPDIGFRLAMYMKIK